MAISYLPHVILHLMVQNFLEVLENNFYNLVQELQPKSLDRRSVKKRSEKYIKYCRRHCISTVLNGVGGEVDEKRVDVL